MTETQVLIIGAGPVGLTLAIDLGQRGVRCVVVERNAAPGHWPKMERCNARTMEIYRRLDIAERIRDAGYPRDNPMDVFIVTSLAEPPLLHRAYPSVNEMKEASRACNDGSRPLEPYQLISQYTLEPILKSVAENTPNVTVRYGCEMTSFVHNDDFVSAMVVNAEKTTETIRASYMVGCDGGSSTVRKQLGIQLGGQANILRLRQALFRCDDLYERIPMGRGRHYHVVDEQETQIVVQDDCRHFTMHSVVAEDADMPAKFQSAVGMPIQFEMLYSGAWTQHLLLADSYGTGRVFLAGDSAHLVIPTGGLGMNTGVGDAIDLSWKLAATLAGWGGANLLGSYQRERRQIGARNVAASRHASNGKRIWRATYKPNIRDDTPEGAQTRENLVRVAGVEQRKVNEQTGTELGYRYIDSPLIWPEAGESPDPDSYVYRPTTWPGARLPHVWLDDGSALHDRIGSGYTLLRLGGTRVDTSALEHSMRHLNAPLAVLDINDDAPREVYGCDLLLLRPDLHVVWRGNSLSVDAEKLASIATGHGMPTEISTAVTSRGSAATV